MKLHLTVLETVKRADPVSEDLTVLETMERADPVSEASSDCVRDNEEG